MPRSDAPGAGSVDPADHPPRALAAADWQWFVDRCAELGIPDPQAQRQPLEALYGHLVGVNAWLNLTRVIAPREWLKLHVLDSLALLGGDVRPPGLGRGAVVVDLGSGGGYPGLPLALWVGEAHVVLIDSRQRKVAFLAAAAGLLPARNAEARCLRGREARAAAPDLMHRARILVTRATGRVADLFADCAPLLGRDGLLCAYKGPAYDHEERNEAEAACERHGFVPDHERRIRLEADDPERVIACFRKL